MKWEVEVIRYVIQVKNKTTGTFYDDVSSKELAWIKRIYKDNKRVYPNLNFRIVKRTDEVLH